MYAGRDRRTHTRYSLPSMYTAVVVRPIGVGGADAEACPLEGHIYDISEGGLRFEIDRAIPAGTELELEIDVPGPTGLRAAMHAPIRAVARVIRLEQDDVEQGGPIRTSAAFESFATEDDHASLLRRVASGRFNRAA